MRTVEPSRWRAFQPREGRATKFGRTNADVSFGEKISATHGWGSL